ncbi:hypothetical protein Scep_008797 [Stephania cephalantha]|uniref:Secreted protein n=1 Tax=Stephania cephalantha TaxID=152367 RepID=A0AAP0JRW0_9MAGN
MPFILFFFLDCSIASSITSSLKRSRASLNPLISPKNFSTFSSSTSSSQTRLFFVSPSIFNF